MNIRILNEQDIPRYDKWIKQHPDGNLWQSLERKAYLEALGKEVRIYAQYKDEQPARHSLGEGGIHASALVVIDRTTGGFSTWEIARGPIREMGDREIGNSGNRELGNEDFLEHIIEDAKQDKCFALYLSPNYQLPTTNYQLNSSKRSIHCEATRIIDLTKSEEDILAQMKQKGRYNIRVAEKSGVTVKESDDIDAFYKLVTETGNRDGFGTLPKKQYEAFLKDLSGSFLLIAYDEENTPISGLLGVIWPDTGIYYYGASSYAHRAKMAPYLLQWEAMLYCKKKGAAQYDLLGIAPPSAPANHTWQGISGFKEKFGGEVIEYPEEKMIVLKPFVYWLLKMKRKLWK